MPKTKISEFSAVPGNNTDIDGINIAEGCAPSGINDAIRELMSQLKDFQAGTAGDSFNGPIGTTTPAAGVFTNLSASGTFALTGDQVQISEGGTGQTTANAAFNALAPSQSTHAGKYLKTDGTNTSWDAIDINTADITGTLPVANGGTGVTSSTGTGSVVLSASPTFTGTVNGAALTLSSSLTLSAGTANGVAYLNGSKVLTTGSALSFDGTNLRVGAPSFAPNTNLAGNLLQLKSASGFAYLTMGNGDGANNTGYIGSASGLLTFGSVTDAGVTSEQMRLTSTGLGIGTSSPGTKLDVRGSVTSQADSAYYRIRRASSADVGYVTDSGTWGDSGTDFAIGASSSNLRFYTNNSATERMRLDSSGNLGLGVTPSAWATYAAFEISKGGGGYLVNNAASGFIGVGQNFYFNGGYKYAATGLSSFYYQQGGAHIWQTAPSGTAGNAISFTQALTLDADGNLMAGVTTSSYRIAAVVASGANRDVFQAGVSGASNGLTVKWNHATTTTRVNIANLPTSSAGLASGDLWNDSGTLKVA